MGSAHVNEIIHLIGQITEHKWSFHDLSSDVKAEDPRRERNPSSEIPTSLSFLQLEVH